MTSVADTPPLEKTVNRTRLRLERGDLTALAADAVVYYARESLELGSGFGTAIGSRGGDAVKKELAKIGGVPMGGAVMTSAGNLAARHVIHACGPKFQEADTESKLRQCMLSALKLACDHGLKTVAFPPMGAGFYGVPLATCARVMLEAVREFLQGDASLENVVVCVMDRREYAAFREEMEK